MENPSYEYMLEEICDLKKALGATRKTLEKSRIEYDSLKKTHEDFKSQ